MALLNRRDTAYRLLIVLIFIASFAITETPAFGAAVRVRVSGLVYDAVTGERLPFVTISSGKKSQTLTDSLGRFSITVPSKGTITVLSEGYTTRKIQGPFGNDTLRIALNYSAHDLSELIVKPKKEKYSKKNNPAVDLMEKVRASYDSLKPDNIDGYNYDSYEKLTMGMSGGPGSTGTWMIPIRDDKKLKNLVDTAIWSGEPIIALGVKEKSSVHLRTKGKNMDVVKGLHSDGIDKSFDNNFTGVFLRDAMRETDVYDNDIMLMRNAFVSPLSRRAADFYKFHIEDTVQIGNDRCVELSFAPHKPEMTGFNGKLYIPLGDSLRYVRRVMMRLPKASNVNYIQRMVLSQNYMLDSAGKIHKTLDDMVLHVKLAPGTPVLYFARETRRKGFGYDGRPELNAYAETIGSEFVESDADKHDDIYWEATRMIPLSRAEQHIFSRNSAFRTDKTFRAVNTILKIAALNYVPTGPENNTKVLIGPIFNSVSHSHIEGWRVQLGGLTTAKLMPHLFFKGYAAYGFRDHKWKGKLETTYSFNPSKDVPLDYPMNKIVLSYDYDVDYIGMINSGPNQTIFSAWSRMESLYATYRHRAVGRYVKEWHNHLMLEAGFEYTRQIPGYNIVFKNGAGDTFSHIGQAIFKASLRWTPGEKFTHTYSERTPVNRDGLILALTQEYGPKKLLGSRFTLSRTTLDVEKSVWLSSFGQLQFRFKGSAIWTQVPFTELLWQKTNTGYITGSHDYVLLNPMEFAMDKFVSWDIQYNMRGLIFDRIPYVNRLRLREYLSFRGFWGHLSKRNDPLRSEGALRFPNPDTTPIGNTPYMECNIGIQNILTFLRVEYVWRLTYRNRPGISHSGVRIGFSFTF